MKARNGKIARLPESIREELNQRLERSEPSPSLLAWLNALPEVQELVRRHFRGQPVSKHNLSQWRLGGFQEWNIHREFFADLGHDRNLPPPRLLADKAASVLAARYLRFLRRWDGVCTKEFEAEAEALGDLCQGVVQLQREVHQPKLDSLDWETPHQNKVQPVELKPVKPNNSNTPVKLNQAPSQ